MCFNVYDNSTMKGLDQNGDYDASFEIFDFKVLILRTTTHHLIMHEKI